MASSQIVKGVNIFEMQRASEKKKSTNSTTIENRSISDNCKPQGLIAISSNILLEKLMLNNVKDSIVVSIPSLQTSNKVRLTIENQM